MKDYFSEALAYINNEPEPTEDEITPVKVEEDINTPAGIITPYISPSGHTVTTSEDGRTITVNNVAYIVPEWYNKDQIAKQDAKTIDMVLIHYGII